MLRDQFLKWCAKISYNHPWKVISVFTLITVLSIILSIKYLGFKTDQDDLMSDELSYVKNYNKFKENFGDLEHIIAVVQVNDHPKEAKELIDRLAKKIRTIKDIKKVISRIKLDFIKSNLLLFPPIKDLEQITKTISLMKDQIKLINNFQNLNQFLEFYNQRLKDKSKMTTYDYYILYFFLKQLQSSLEGEKYPLLLKKAFLQKTSQLQDNGYIFSDNKKLLFLLILPKKNYKTLNVIQEPLNQIRSYIKEIKKDYPMLKVGLTGQPVLQADEMSSVGADMIIGSILSLIGVGLIFMLVLRNIVRPFLSVIVLTVSILITFGVTTFYPGHLTILSIVFTTMIIGLGIEYSIHLIARYHEELSLKKSVEEALTNTLQYTGRGNITGTITTSVSFYMTMFIDFKGLSELGFIAGTGLIITLLAVLLLLPAILTLHDRKRSWEQLNATTIIQFHMMENLLKYSRTIIAVTLIVIIGLVSIIGIKGLSFNDNFLDLQADGVESVEYEKIIMKNTKESSWFSTHIIANDLNDSDKISNKTKSKANIGKIETLRRFIPRMQDEKLLLVNQIRDHFKNISIPDKGKEISLQNMTAILNQMNKNIQTHNDVTLSEKLIPLLDPIKDSQEIITNLKTSIQTQPETAHTRLLDFQNRLLEDLSFSMKLFKELLNPYKIDIQSLPEGLRDRHVGKDNKLLVYVYPNKNIWNPKYLEDFVKDVRSIDKDAVGATINIYESSIVMKKGFILTAIYALIAVFILLLVDYRSLKFTSLAFMPLILGLIILFGIMALLNIQFNMANFFSIPILIGSGIDYGVQIVHRFRETKSANIITRSTGSAIILHALTTIMGFGTLMITDHRGIFSLGLIMTIGTATVFFTSIMVLPSVLKYLEKKNSII